MIFDGKIRALIFAAAGSVDFLYYTGLKMVQRRFSKPAG